MISYKIINRIVSSVLVAALILCLGAGVYGIADNTVIENVQKESGGSLVNYAPFRRTAYINNDAAAQLKAVSANQDLQINIYKADGEPFSGVAFEIVITSSDGTNDPISVIDDDMDGSVYVSSGDINPGDYIVTVKRVDGIASPSPARVSVARRVVYEKVDVTELLENDTKVELEGNDNQYGNNRARDESTSNVGVVNDVVYVNSHVETSYKQVEETVVKIKGDTVSQNDKYYLTMTNGSTSVYSVTTDGDGYITAISKDVFITEQVTHTVENPVNQTPEGQGEGTTQVVTEEVTRTDVQNGWDDLIDGDGNVKADTGINIRNENVTVKVQKEVKTYYGWQVLDGFTYYFNNGVPVTGVKVIQGTTYIFDDQGRRGSNGSVSLGIDVSAWNDNINWQQVKASGVDFVVLRVGGRGYGTGSVYADSNFYDYYYGALNAGIKVGVYFFSAAVTVEEAIEEASYCLAKLDGRGLNYPIFIDLEYATSWRSGRADYLAASLRTQIAIAFCETIRSGGYMAGVYASQSFFEYELNDSQLTGYYVWVANYTGSTDIKPSYKKRYDIWQYTGSGSCPGVSTKCDMNFSYLGW